MKAVRSLSKMAHSLLLAVGILSSSPCEPPHRAAYSLSLASPRVNEPREEEGPSRKILGDTVWEGTTQRHEYHEVGTIGGWLPHPHNKK